MDSARSRLIFALDYPDLEQARAGVQAVKGEVGVVKVGLQLFVRYGPAAVALGRDSGLEVFLDLKLHDIPATVGRAVTSALSLGARYLTVHAAGGRAMLAEAVRCAAAGADDLEIVAITVLTSLDESDLALRGIHEPVGDQVERLARLAWDAGVRAFVCSPVEVGKLREVLGPEARLITPGVRPAGAQTQDQKRVRTPGEAIAQGASMLVVGRPIRDADVPAAAARAIVAEIAGAHG